MAVSGDIGEDAAVLGHPTAMPRSAASVNQGGDGRLTKRVGFPGAGKRVFNAVPEQMAVSGDIGEDAAVLGYPTDIIAAIGKLRGYISVQNDKIVDKIESLSARIESILLVRNDSPNLGNAEYEALHILSATSHEELKCIELEFYSNAEYRKFLVEYLKKRSSNLMYKCSGGDQISAATTNCINDCCTSLMTNELAVKYSMTGRFSGKVAFEATFPCAIDIILVAINEKVLPGSVIDLAKAKNRIGEWLRQAKRRTEEEKAARAAQYLASMNPGFEWNGSALCFGNDFEPC
ncbi:uncharacterized protein LOC124173254 [Ischnura elegans]|uniref:uncharacterized protein LOC124173254 n=1 Tax=Ischnura elegans TaxID=197161 RepID=UPI001ED8843C|nr:uncharacterized protein LOC124173254 [Ischnura elegans]